MWIYIVSSQLKVVINIAFNYIVTFMCILLTYSDVNTHNTSISLLCMNVSEDAFSYLIVGFLNKACFLYHFKFSYSLFKINDAQP